MDPVTVGIILGSIALVSSIISNIRVRSRCHTQNLDLSFQKRFDEDIANKKQLKQLQDLFTSTSDYDSSSE